MKDLTKLIEELGMTQDEAGLALKQLSKPQKTVNHHKHHFHPRHVKIGVIGDTHIGSKYFNEQIFQDSVKTFTKESVDAIYHAGDVIEGMSNREGHIYELDTIGTTAQVERASHLLSQYKQPFFFTTGNHDEWCKTKSNQGVLVGKQLEALVKGSFFLGEYTANVEIAKGVNMCLTHEGQSAYALSYSLQKRINGMEGGTKPDILLNGHLHKFLYMFYRNIHAFEVGTMQNQTPFMRMKGSPAMTGYWILDLEYDKTGLKSIKQTAKSFT